jgi:hypothetical protein
VTADETGDPAELAAIAGELDHLADRLTDVVIERLRSALEADERGAQAAAAFERRMNRARRSLEKAASILDPQRTHADS